MARVLALVSLVLILGCGAKSESLKATVASAPQAPRIANREAEVVAQADAGKPNAPVADAPPATTQRKIKYSAEMALIVEDFSRADEALFDLVETNKGYIARSDIAASAGSIKQGSWKVRVPVEHFNAFLRDLRKLGEVEKDARDSQDVTEEYHDLESYIKTRQTELDSLRELMKKEASNRDQYLAYRREINAVEADVNKSLGRIKLLANLTDYTTVTVTLREKQKFAPPPPPDVRAELPDFATRAGTTWQNSLDLLTDLGTRVALVLIALAPWLPIVAIGCGFARFAIRRLRTALRPAGANLRS